MQPGDELALIPQKCKGKTAWVLARKEVTGRPWAGKLHRYAKHAQGDHSIEAVRKSSETGRIFVRLKPQCRNHNHKVENY